jgi:hypothetical protein
MRFSGLFFQISYHLRRHVVMGVRMDIFLVAACLLGALVTLGQKEWSWGMALLTLALGGFALVIIAGRKGYLLFLPDSNTHLSPPYPVLEPDTELLIRASGHFAIRDQVCYLVEHQTILTTSRSREHILMAKLQPGRFLLIGHSRSSEWGWWYQFLKAEAIDQVVLGVVIHGWQPRLALQVRYQIHDRGDQEETAETILSFDDQETRALAWAGLTYELCELATTA